MKRQRQPLGKRVRNGVRTAKRMAHQEYIIATLITSSLQMVTSKSITGTKNSKVELCYDGACWFVVCLFVYLFTCDPCVIFEIKEEPL